MRKCGQIMSKIRDQRIGEGGRSSPCPSGVAVDEADPGRMDMWRTFEARLYIKNFPRRVMITILEKWTIGLVCVVVG